jgi:hypothetical protein
MVVTVSVLLSIILWLSLTLDEQYTRQLQLPVQVVETPEGKSLAEVPPSSVRAQVTGSRFDLIRLLYSPKPIEVRGTTGQVNVKKQIQRPNVQVRSVTPSSFTVKLESTQTRRVPVRGRVGIELATGYKLINDPQFRPDSVRVKGAQSIVDTIEAWPTDSTTVTDLQDTVRVQVSLADTLNRLVETSTDAVTLVARAGRFSEETRKVKVQVVGVPSGQDVVALQPPSIQIRYRVLFKQLFKARRSTEFFATVSYDQIRSDTTGYVTPRVHVPSDLIIRDATPVPSRLRYYTFLSGE